MRATPTARAGAFAGIGALLVVVGTTAQAGWLFVLAAAVGGPILASVLLVPRVHRCRPGRSIPPRMSIGESVPVAISIHNSGRRFIPLVRVEDEFPPTAPAAVVCDGLEPGATAETEVHVVAERRGRYEAGPMRVWSSWPFGLVRSARTVSAGSPVVVTPRWVELATFPVIEAAMSFLAEHDQPRFRAGGGDQFLGVREYRPGDDVRRMHWRSTARSGRLVVREFEEEVSHRVVIVLAGGDHGTPPDSSFEALVSAAASVALFAADSGQRVELVRPAEHGHERFAGAGRADVLDWLASAVPIDAPPAVLVEATLNATGDAAIVVLVSSTAGRAAAGIGEAVALAARRGCPTVAVLVDAASWDESAAPSHGDIAKGTSVKIVRRGEDLRACLQR